MAAEVNGDGLRFWHGRDVLVLFAEVNGEVCPLTSCQSMSIGYKSARLRLTFSRPVGGRLGQLLPEGLPPLFPAQTLALVLAQALNW